MFVPSFNQKVEEYHADNADKDTPKEASRRKADDIKKCFHIFVLLLKVSGSSFFLLLKLSDPSIKLLNVVMSAKLIKYFGKSYILCVKNT